ncbi:MAG: hypothetical protein A2428_01410 [Bdellovibrionales bacterium RIFOXYC1_FULL_54_43]|nr:MAG: hypothetical protein A2428_01410 [Bdellovibrionales bacterium RIFOXYC1_FULL_54_43]OFZ85257.1 MAG: hypothetical protein A2603_08165 [Bdellovibrionales bacterium RIFOXYD1_FULL_55_31]
MSKKKYSVLIVEDEADIVDVISTKLNAEGFQVFSTPRAPRAIQLLNNQKFSCILLDMSLEQGSGEDVISSIRKDKTSFNFQTPVLVISANLNPNLIMRIGKDIHGALVKPFERDALVAKVKSLCPASAAGADQG